MSMTDGIQRVFLGLSGEMGIGTFVEGGTYYGRTSAWACNHFGKVITVEASREIYQCNQQKQWPENLDMHLGETVEVLPRILQPGTYAFWLDAHWSADETYLGQDECPIVKEIDIVDQLAPESLIVIDDARYFTSPPPPPHDPDAWPDLAFMMDRLRQAGDRYIIIFDDAFIVVPRAFQQALIQIITDVIDHRLKEAEEARRQRNIQLSVWGRARRKAKRLLAA